jgi:hypothetical protein
MTRYYCNHCGWEGEDIIHWEEHPRDEFYLKCPKCHHIDTDIMRFDGEVWVPAVVYREPTPEEIEQRKRFYTRLSELLASTNIYLEAVYQIQEREE